MMYRQGDVLIKKIAKIPSGLSKRENRVLVEGEATGHCHKATAGDVYDGENGELFLQTITPTIIEHEEHDPIELPTGDYEIIRQREYTKDKMIRLVVD